MSRRVLGGINAQFLPGEMLIIGQNEEVGQIATAVCRPIRWNYRIPANSLFGANNIQVRADRCPVSGRFQIKMNGFDNDGGETTKCGACSNSDVWLFLPESFILW
jgi:hypothetical protein